MAKTVTAANTGLSITRNGNKFTASWKIKTKSPKSQKVRYRVHNGTKWLAWHTKTIGKSATSYSFTLSASSKIRNVQVQTQILKDDKKYTVSAWGSSSAKFKITKPAAPSLSVENTSANATKFTWTNNAKSTGSGWYYRCMYRTKCDKDPNGSKGWSKWAHAANSSYSYTDNTLGTTRVFQIKAVGPGGTSAVVKKYHAINVAQIATWGDPAVSHSTKSSYYQMTYNVNITGSALRIDKVTPQYLIDTPLADMSCPNGANWTDGTEFSYDSKKNKYALAVTTSAKIGPDECLWARVKTEHDGVDSFSAAYRVITGDLTDPVLTLSIGTVLKTGFSVDISVDDAGTDVPGAYMEVYLERYSAMGLENYILIGTIPNGTSTTTITSTEDLTDEDGFAIHIRNVTADGVSMKSGYYTYATTMASAPTFDSLMATTTEGKVYLQWTNNWADATGVIIAWTDDPDNWMSNEEPETYEIKEIASSWFITGLETGKRWYFRIRAVKEVGESETLSPWSDELDIDLSSAPAVPVLYLSDETITEDGMVTAYWSYVSSDGTGQVAGNIVEATYSGGVWTFGDSVGATTTEQHIDLYAADHGWVNGSTIYLALQTRSGSGGESEYSTPVELVIAAKPTAAITATSFINTENLVESFIGDGVADSFVCANNLSAAPTVTVEGAAATVSSYTDDTVTLATVPDDGDEVVISYTTTDNTILDTMPLDVSVDTTNATNLTVAIERATTYPLLRPDGVQTDGPEGETVYVTTIAADDENDISIILDDLIGRLDDGAWYTLIATASDDYGQSVEATRILFKVHWAHQAWDPTATFITDDVNYIARITPVAGADYVSGDTCDIYRLGADAPELIIQGGQFGTEYVDPFPAFGRNSGYKIVTVTAMGDYITEIDDFAEYDTIEADDGAYVQLDPGTMVIDFDGQRAELEYNIGLGNKWAKDFQRTTYLGGHVTGDHNKAVTRDLSGSTVIVRDDDGDLAVIMRALARYAGLCHVRTPEGSSFMADVQVDEAQAFNSPTIEYSLSIQKVDTVGLDGMTYAEWSETQ